MSDAYRLAIEMDGHLLKLHNKIRDCMNLADHPELPKAVRDLAAGFKHDLERLGCLTAEQAYDIGEAEAEVAQAESTANHDEKAALSRAIYRLNRVFLSVNEAFFEAEKNARSS